MRDRNTNSSESPLVSVVIPTYNRRSTIVEAVESVLRQDVHDIEVLVIDDGSTDGTFELLAQQFGSSIHVVRKPNGGVASARNEGVRLSRGKWIAFLDSDDVWMPGKLKYQLGQLSENKGAIAHFCNARFSSQDGDGPSLTELRGIETATSCLVFERPIVPVLQYGQLFLQCFIVESRIAKLYSFDPLLKMSEDRDYILNIASNGPFIIGSEELVQIRRIPSDLNALTVLGKTKLEHYTIEAYRSVLRTSKLTPEETKYIRSLVSGLLYDQSQSVGCSFLRSISLNLRAFMTAPNLRIGFRSMLACLGLGKVAEKMRRDKNRGKFQR